MQFREAALFATKGKINSSLERACEAKNNQGHYNEALKHFHMASEVDSRIGESHYNEAISLDALGRHGEATDHFFVARKYASGNLAILQSQILNAHAPMDREGS